MRAMQVLPRHQNATGLALMGARAARAGCISAKHCLINPMRASCLPDDGILAVRGGSHVVLLDLGPGSRNAANPVVLRCFHGTDFVMAAAVSGVVRDGDGAVQDAEVRRCHSDCPCAGRVPTRPPFPADRCASGTPKISSSSAAAPTGPCSRPGCALRKAWRTACRWHPTAGRGASGSLFRALRWATSTFGRLTTHWTLLRPGPRQPRHSPGPALRAATRRVRSACGPASRSPVRTPGRSSPCTWTRARASS